MADSLQPRAWKYISENRRRRRRRKTVTILSSLVVFCTTYALILPAITMEHTCGMEEHTHTAACYTQLLPPEEPEAVCGLVENEEHQHTEICYDSGVADPNALTCENTDPNHVHDPLCYGDWMLTCPLPEHVHDESCGAKAEPSETPTEPTENAESLAEESEAEDGEEETPGVLETALTEMLSLFSANSASTAVPTADTSETTAAEKVEAKFTPTSVCGNCPSDKQVDNAGGTNTYAEDGVTVSKTLEGTDIENVFDITLTVETPQQIGEIVHEPDMAVVIVMDISATMNDKFPKDSDTTRTTRYDAAMAAASDFLDNFAANNTLGVSKVGYVAFNTDAHKIFDLQSCTNETEANKLKGIMRTKTGNIINASEYDESHSRFTNMQAGLKMAQDMLDKVNNQNKFVIFLTDGFPTTYIQSGYTGIDPYGKNFYDSVLGKWCLYGTSYSDAAAKKAKEQAESMKKSGTTIFSIGIDVSGQKLQKYITDSENANGFSVVERKDTNYEIGGTEAKDFVKWLKEKISSNNYYYDSTDTSGLKDAYKNIFETIQDLVWLGSEADWVATDPMPPVSSTPPGEIELIGLYGQDGELHEYLEGEYKPNGENTASQSDEDNDGVPEIKWDLKSSGYELTEPETGKQIYKYQLKYRVRLKNEEKNFIETDNDGKTHIYATNGETSLRYKVVKNDNNKVTISDPKEIDFPIPAVHGYLGELTFKKVDQNGEPLEGVKFTLSHADGCTVCHGDKVPVENYDRLSDQEGTVRFTEIPSGHTYTLTETVPDGYNSDGNHYTVTVAYDKVTVTVKDYTQSTVIATWTPEETATGEKTIINYTYYELPATGGVGTAPYTLGGLSLLALAGLLSVRRRRRKGAGA